MAKQMRDSNIELLRILSVLGVVILHFNGIYGNALAYVEPHSWNGIVLRCLECLCLPAVNVFVLISGYYLCDSYKRTLGKPTLLLIQVMLFGELVYLGQVLVAGMHTFSITSAISALIPCNYYAILYIALYFLSPYLNLIWRRFDDRQWDVFVLVSFLIASVFPICVDVLQEVSGRTFAGLNPIGLYGDQGGYTIVQFCFMYVLGAYIKKRQKLFLTRISLVVVLSCVAILFIWSLWLPESAWMYCNPFVILEAVSVFCLFQQMNIRIPWLNRASKAVFTCYLLHGYLVKWLPLEAIATSPIWQLLIVLIIMLPAIYVICWCVYEIYRVFETYVLKNILKKWNAVVLDTEPQNEGELCK